ncbi:MAG TPA: hypothetical protein VMU69_02680 [Bradyrhizobium sp.]|nr:hypothetical protein [Bradyrhizobium sp.]
MAGVVSVTKGLLVMSFKLSFLVAAGLLLSLGPAAAQIPGQRLVIEPQVPQFRPGGMVRVTTSVNLFVPGPTGESDDARKSRDNARRMIYEMAAHECDLLRDTLAKECRLESVSVNIGRQFGVQQQEGYTLNGTMNFQVTPK